MERYEQHLAWIERVEDLVNMLADSTIGELELTEAGMEIIIRRQPGMVLISAPTSSASMAQASIPLTPGVAAPATQQDTGVAILAPLTGVYYSAPSPSSPPFVSVGDVVQVGQVVALIEAMKVFNEIQAQLSGRVSTIVATSGEVVQKGDALILMQAT
ncbi:MAG: acetyl-CoA carboxylase biotin carboxyl carrier protein [Ktedonobacteraceae bacterium]